MGKRTKQAEVILFMKTTFKGKLIIHMWEQNEDIPDTFVEKIERIVSTLGGAIHERNANLVDTVLSPDKQESFHSTTAKTLP